GRRQGPATPRTLQDEEDLLRVGGGALLAEVAGKGREKAGGDGYPPLVAALAGGNKDPPLARGEVTQAQAEHLATAKATEEHRFDHGTIALGAQCGQESVSRLGREHPRQGARGPQQGRPT